MRAIRGKHIGFVFQDPLSSLHPLKSIGTQVGEALTAHGRVPKRERRRRVIELLDEVGIRSRNAASTTTPSTSRAVCVNGR
jgi:peptide/nickel transport system ATP-binding protein